MNIEQKIKNKPKTLLFHNGDFHKQKPVKFYQLIKMPPEKIAKIFLTHNYRQNTGMLLMSDSLAKNLDAKWIPAHYNFEGTKADAVVTNVLHCISPDHYWDREYWKRILDTGIKIVPISLGFRYDKNGEVYLNQDMLYILGAISERNEIGVRGEFAADVLHKNHIRNVRIIGCPSLYYHMNPDFKIKKNIKDKVEKINFNFNLNFLELCDTHSNFIKNHVKIFNYFYNLFKLGRNIGYTMQTQFFKEISGYNFFVKYDMIKDFLLKTGRYFFSVEDWIKGLSNTDFSIGTQIHGNIAAILAGIPALPICVDKRMQEMSMYHGIPYIKLEDFDTAKPIEYYFDLCDFSDFNLKYKQNFDNFIDYCNKNSIALKMQNNY